ncbi:MAG: hypothetical protein KA795_20485, partial [Burkholderiaceae bacterium]|nr:hypothetical protein [Burkholderiaceae bacterium]
MRANRLSPRGLRRWTFAAAGMAGLLAAAQAQPALQPATACRIDEAQQMFGLAPRPEARIDALLAE